MFHPAKDFATENADPVGLTDLRKRLNAPGAQDVAAAIKAALVDLHREVPDTLKRSTIARAVLMAARDMADPGDAKTLTILIEADGPRNRCAMGCESSAEDVMFHADELRAVVRMWEDEAERVLGEGV
jgi:hypothetical protein